MEEGDSVLDAIYEENDGVEDVEMLDVEEGEIMEQKSQTDLEHTGVDSGGCGGAGNQSKNRRRREKRKKNKKTKISSGPKFTDINRFVLDTCRRLREKKSYMVYTAVGCLGISRLSDLVTEVDAIQSCGGQMTADGKRCRTGGGILWKIMKTKEPMAYQEIMKKAKEFEKQFKGQNTRQTPQQKKEVSSQEIEFSSDGPPSSVLGDVQLAPQNKQERTSAEQKHKSVHERIRVAVSYDDLLGDDPKNDSSQLLST